MKSTLVLLMGVLALSMTSVHAQARGRNVSLAPSEAVLLPAGEAGVTQVAFRFDLRELPAGRSRVITRANLEWVVSGLTAESECNIYAHAIIQPWVGQRAAAGGESVVTEEVDVAAWAVEPPDFSRRGGYVKLNLTDLLRDWDDGTVANHGVVITFSDISRSELGQVLDSARLNVRVGVDE